MEYSDINLKNEISKKTSIFYQNQFLKYKDFSVFTNQEYRENNIMMTKPEIYPGG